MSKSKHKIKIKIVYDKEAKSYFYSVKCPYHRILAYTPFWDYSWYVINEHCKSNRIESKVPKIK